jgi:hypothetical protein
MIQTTTPYEKGQGRPEGASPDAVDRVPAGSIRQALGEPCPALGVAMPITGAGFHHATDLRRFQSIADPARRVDTSGDGIDKSDIGLYNLGPARSLR